MSPAVTFMIGRTRLFARIGLLAEEVRRFMSVQSVRASFLMLVLVMMMRGVAVQIRSSDRYTIGQVSWRTRFRTLSKQVLTSWA